MASINSDNNSREMLWLVKSDDRILGPFNTSEVERKLVARELTVFDEVLKPFGRWKHLRVEEVFQQAVERVRNDLMNSKEDTEVQAPQETNITRTDTKTIPLEPVGDSAGGVEVELEGELLAEEHIAPVEHKAGRTRSFGLESEKPQLRAGVREARVLWGLFGSLAVLTVGAYFWMSGNFTAASESRKAYSDLIIKSNEALANGDGLYALKLLGDAESRRQAVGLVADPEATLKLAALRMSYNGETVVAKRLAEEVLSQSKSSDVRAKASNILAMAAVRNEDYGVARRLLSELGLSSPEIAFNRAVVDYLLGENDSAASILRKLMVARLDFSEAQLFLARTLVAESKSSRILSREARDILEGLRRRKGVYAFDATVMMAALALRSDEKQNGAVYVSRAFEEDPVLVEDQVPNVFLMKQTISPSSLVPDCHYIHKTVGSMMSHALLVVCLSRAGEGSQALKEINILLGTKPHDLLLKSVQALVLSQMGREDEARTVLKMARTSPETPTLGFLLLARDCQVQSDITCENQAWESLMKMPSPPVAALLGHARWLQRQGQTQEAKFYFRRVQEVAPDLKQLTQLSKAFEP